MKPDPLSETPTNLDDYEYVRNHAFTKALLGRVFHATTPANFLQILRDGEIEIGSPRNGIYSVDENQSKSVCINHEAVSVFDLAVPEEEIFRLVSRGGGIVDYRMQWWDFLNLAENVVVIFLRDEVRDSYMAKPDGPGKFIEGVENCHLGTINSGLFTDYLCRIGKSPGELYAFDTDRVGELELLAHNLVNPKAIAEVLQKRLDQTPDREELLRGIKQWSRD